MKLDVWYLSFFPNEIYSKDNLSTENINVNVNQFWLDNAITTKHESNYQIILLI